MTSLRTGGKQSTKRPAACETKIECGKNMMMVRSPHGQRKLFAKHKVSGGKHIAPPTVESIHRAKSLSSLVEVGTAEANEQRSRGRTPVPGSLKPSLSQTALHHTSPSLSSTSRHASQYRSSGALYEAAARKEAILLDRLSPGPASITSSRVSSNQPEFSKRHPDTSDHQMESFQVDIVKPPLEVKPPPIYFEKSSTSNYSDSTEQHRSIEKL